MNAWDEAYLSSNLAQKKSFRKWTKGTTFRNGMSGQRNQCAACGELFSGEKSFDMHRVGPYGKPDGTPSNRRCLTVPEIEKTGLARNEQLYWGSQED